MTTITGRVLATALLLFLSAGIAAQDKAEYDGRNVARHLELFRALDRNADGAVTWLEAQGHLDFIPRFNDLDVDRDGVVTTAELHRYLGQAHDMPADRQPAGK